MADLFLRGKKISELKLVEIRDELAKRNIPKKGNKASILKRLEKTLIQEKQSEESNACLPEGSTKETEENEKASTTSVVTSEDEKMGESVTNKIQPVMPAISNEVVSSVEEEESRSTTKLKEVKMEVAPVEEHKDEGISGIKQEPSQSTNKTVKTFVLNVDLKRATRRKIRDDKAAVLAISEEESMEDEGHDTNPGHEEFSIDLDEQDSGTEDDSMSETITSTTAIPAAHRENEDTVVNAPIIEPSYPRDEELIYEGDVDHEEKTEEEEEENLLIYDVNSKELDLDESNNQRALSSKGKGVLKRSAHQGVVESSSCNVWVSKLSPTVSAADLKTFFSSVGQVLSVRVVAKTQDKGERYAYIIMGTSEQAKKAIGTLNGTELKGKPVKIDFAKSSFPCAVDKIKPKVTKETSLTSKDSSSKVTGTKSSKNTNKTNKDSPNTGNSTNIARTAHKLITPIDDGDKAITDSNISGSVGSRRIVAVESRNGKKELYTTRNRRNSGRRPRSRSRSPLGPRVSPRGRIVAHNTSPPSPRRRVSPHRLGSPPRRLGSPPRRLGSPPRRLGSPPRRLGSPPRRQGSPPRRQGSPPRRQGSPPRRRMNSPPFRRMTPPPSRRSHRLSPRRLSPRRLSPRRLSPRRLSPRRLSPRSLSPRRSLPHRRLGSSPPPLPLRQNLMRMESRDVHHRLGGRMIDSRDMNLRLQQERDRLLSEREREREALRRDLHMEQARKEQELYRQMREIQERESRGRDTFERQQHELRDLQKSFREREATLQMREREIKTREVHDRERVSVLERQREKEIRDQQSLKERELRERKVIEEQLHQFRSQQKLILEKEQKLKEQEEKLVKYKEEMSRRQKEEEEKKEREQRRKDEEERRDRESKLRNSKRSFSDDYPNQSSSMAKRPANDEQNIFVRLQGRDNTARGTSASSFNSPRPQARLSPKVTNRLPVNNPYSQNQSSSGSKTLESLNTGLPGSLYPLQQQPYTNRYSTGGINIRQYRTDVGYGVGNSGSTNTPLSSVPSSAYIGGSSNPEVTDLFKVFNNGNRSVPLQQSPAAPFVERYSRRMPPPLPPGYPMRGGPSFNKRI